MKQYDYIFHPDSNSNGEWTVQGMDLENECVERSQGPVICMTIEELREVWNKGYVRGCEEAEAKKIVGDSTLGIFPTTA